MAKQRETVFKERVRRDLETLEYIWICKTQQVAVRGIPDFLLSVAGHFVALELKADSFSAISHLQKYNIQRVKASGGLGFVAAPENWGKIFELLKKLQHKLKLKSKLEEHSLDVTN